MSSYVQSRGATGTTDVEVSDVFKCKLGKTKAMKHFIHISDSRPMKQRPYRLPHTYWEEVK